MFVCLRGFVSCCCLRKSSVVVLVFLTTMWMFSVVGLLRAAAPDDAEDSTTAAIIFDSQVNPHADSYIHALFLQNLLTHFNLRADLIPLDQYKRGQLGDTTPDS